MKHRWVVCAANLQQDGSIVLGARHFDALMRAHPQPFG